MGPAKCASLHRADTRRAACSACECALTPTRDRVQIWASEEAGWTVLVHGSTIRRWAADFESMEQTETRDACYGEKPVLTFSPLRTGQHVTWLLDNEILHRLGYSYDFARKNVYCDGFNREDVVKFREEVYLAASSLRRRRRALPNASRSARATSLRDDEADVLEGEDGREDEEEKGIERDLSKSIVHVLSRFSDFASEMCLLENAIVELGGLCTWLPKFHAPSAFRAMMLTEPATVRKYFRKARAYQQARSRLRSL